MGIRKILQIIMIITSICFGQSINEINQNNNNSLDDESITENYIDTEIIKNILNSILDSLKYRFPNFFIPNKEMFIGGTYYVKELLEHPFYIEGDFNNDQFNDYVFLLKSIFPFEYSKWGNKQILVIFYSLKSSDGENIKYRIVDKLNEEGIGFHVISITGLVKLEQSIENKFRGNKTFKFDSENILIVSHGNDVGYVIKFNNEEFHYDYLWNTL